ncbi:MAG: hypothetical protein ABS904_00020 [Solibacillus isronensis]
MSESTKLKIWVGGIIVFGLAMFQIMPMILEATNIDSTWIMFILVLGVLIVPQATAQKNLRVLEQSQYEDEVDWDVPAKVIDFIPFASDWELTRLYNNGEIVNVITTWILRISGILLVISLLYVNLFIIWVDLGYDFTLLMMNTVTYSAYAYFVSKMFVIIQLLTMINANFLYSVVLGITVFMGFMYLGYMVRVYLSNQDDSVYERRLGEEYD